MAMSLSQSILLFSNRGLFALIILAALDERTIAQAPRS
jgi:hypothetical protein